MVLSKVINRFKSLSSYRLTANSYFSAVRTHFSKKSDSRWLLSLFLCFGIVGCAQLGETKHRSVARRPVQELSSGAYDDYGSQLIGSVQEWQDFEKVIVFECYVDADTLSTEGLVEIVNTAGLTIAKGRLSDVRTSHFSIVVVHVFHALPSVGDRVIYLKPPSS